MQKGRRKLLDLLIEWGLQRPAQLGQDAHVLQRTGQALDARFKVRNLQTIVVNVHINNTPIMIMFTVAVIHVTVIITTVTITA